MVQQLKWAKGSWEKMGQQWFNGSSTSRFPVLQGFKWFEDSNGAGIQMG